MIAQQEDFTNHITFFHKQKATYQKWLDVSGVGEVLQVHDLKIFPQRISLYLSFRSESNDTITNAWYMLKDYYEQKNPTKLESQLFYKLYVLMEVSQDLIDIQIYDTYDKSKKAVFFRGIYFEGGKVMVDQINPKSKIREIKLKPPNLSNMKYSSVESFLNRYDKETIFKLVQSYARKKYEQTNCEDRNPKLTLLETDEVLRFEVENLCREVLTDEANPTLCRILKKLNYNCNWAKRELLVFTVSYLPSLEGFNLYIEIDGKYGSGFYDKIRRGSYLSMEIDFDSYLERYADTFKEDLKLEILYGKD